MPAFNRRSESKTSRKQTHQQCDLQEEIEII